MSIDLDQDTKRPKIDKQATEGKNGNKKIKLKVLAKEITFVEIMKNNKL